MSILKKYKQNYCPNKQTQHNIKHNTKINDNTKLKKQISILKSWK